MAEFGGRIEDARLLAGRGRFVADDLPEGCLHAVFLRADRASARLASLDAGPARAMPGVALVLTAADFEAAGVPGFPAEAMPMEDSSEAVAPAMPLLAGGAVRHLGEPLAMVVAASRAAALDAAEALDVALEEARFAGSLAFRQVLGDRAAAEAALAASAHVARARIEVPRLSAAPLETRGALAVPDAAGGLLLRSSTQNPFAVRRGLAELFGWPESGIRVQAGDVGGSFGQKGFLSREEAVLAFAARRLGRPVAWSATRSETFAADHQARGVAGRIALGLDRAGRFTAVLGEFEVDVGAYPGRGATGILNNAAGITGVYAIAQAAAVVSGHYSPLPPLAPFRGNGRPEATLAIEQAIDRAARALGADPVELRRRNLVPASAMPYRTALGFDLDCGAFARVFDAALQGAGPEARAARRRRASARGRLYGFGFAACVESAGGPVRRPRPDRARITVPAEGPIRLSAGALSAGQGHETGMVRLASRALGLPEDRFAYVNGDTGALSEGRGMGGSSGLAVAGPALAAALERLLGEGKARAAARFGGAVTAVRYAEGVFAEAGTNRSATLAELAGAEGWAVEAEFRPEAAVFPNGAHLCELEIDPETGAVTLLRYRGAEDIGRVLNPDLAAGQLHGGIAMGLSEALGEALVHDAEGQLLSGSLMDYALPRADGLPAFELATVEVPTARNPLGVKGVGEAGTVGALAAAMSAIGDALAGAGVAAFQMPATPGRVWQVLEVARRGGAG